MKDLLMRAVESGERLEMIYLSKNNDLTQRVIKVMKVKEGSFKAYCYMRRQFRTFKLSNILSIGPIRKHYKRGA
jgi:predicted DNA-binding transcriptional regulator YafY